MQTHRKSLENPIVAAVTAATLTATVTASTIGSMVGGFLMDALITTDSSLNGHFASYHEMKKNPKDVGKMFDFIVGPLLDGIIGAVIGYKIYQYRNALIPAVPRPVSTKNVGIMDGLDTLPPPPKMPSLGQSQLHSPKLPSLPLPPPPKMSAYEARRGISAAMIQRHVQYKKSVAEKVIDIVD